jgi:ATP-dependent exoDNAse (exonuclease V) alpha subunit
MTQDRALSILKTGANVFLTGEPGAGKTYTINAFVQYMRDAGVEVAITASTGIAATHIGGMTIHSWSGIGIKSMLTKYDLDRLASNEYVVKRISRAKILVIDEVSMLSHAMLSMVDAVIREVKQSDEPFGGMQVILVGDFFQLPPVVRQENREGDSQELFDEDNRPPLFAYESPAWKRLSPVICYLTEQHRQDDEAFFGLLNAIRTDSFTVDHLEFLDERKKLSLNVPSDIPKLFSHNADVDMINTRMLNTLTTDQKVYTMASHGKEALVAMLQKGCLSPVQLVLKIGAEVMFTKNNPKDGFANGTLGIVVGFEKESGVPIVKTRNGKEIKVHPMEWALEENGKVKAEISQIPLRHAWAITVHKSQGMSMDAAVLDLSQVFEYGQGYVALSRVRRLSGLYIQGWNPMAFKVHPSILEVDGEFRDLSVDAENAFAKIPEKELQKMHENFIIASGGKIRKKKSPPPSAKPGDPSSTRRGKSNKEIDKIEGGSYQERLAKLREKHPNAYMPWKDDEDKRLTESFKSGKAIKELVVEFGRQNGSIRARLEKLGLIEK